MHISKTLLFAVALALPAAAGAQSAPPYGAPITLDAAKKIVAAAEAEAKKNNWTMVITVVDPGGLLVLSQRMDNTQTGSLRIADGKARTAVELRTPTKAFQDLLASGSGGAFIATVPGMVAIQGGEPIISGGKVIGAVGVSGGSPAQDQQVASASLAAVGK